MSSAAGRMSGGADAGQPHSSATGGRPGWPPRCPGCGPRDRRLPRGGPSALARCYYIRVPSPLRFPFTRRPMASTTRGHGSGSESTLDLRTPHTWWPNVGRTMSARPQLIRAIPWVAIAFSVAVIAGCRNSSEDPEPPTEAAPVTCSSDSDCRHPLTCVPKWKEATWWLAPLVPKICVHVCEDSEDCAADEICFRALDHGNGMAECMRIVPQEDGGNSAAAHHQKSGR